MTETSAAATAAILRQYGIRPRRRLGQNFLHDPDALRHVVDAAALEPTDVVLEIGCGLGNLTNLLAETAARVIAIEIDGRLASAARRVLQNHRTVEVIQGDFLRLSSQRLQLPAGYVVAANIPYYVTAPILRKLLETEPRPRRIVLTVQREVAERLSAGIPHLSLLAVSVQVYGQVKLVSQIPASSFYPVPRVDSAVVRIDTFEHSPVWPTLMATFFEVVRAGFSQPRKMLRNSLASGLGIQLNAAEELLHTAGLDPHRRAETVSVDDWIQLSKVVSRRTG